MIRAFAHLFLHTLSPHIGMMMPGMAPNPMMPNPMMGAMGGGVPMGTPVDTNVQNGGP